MTNKTSAEGGIETIKNRREYLFIYDVVNANPNGDPLEENKPRMDEESGRVFVTDVRLKRVIRDTLEELGECIFYSQRHKAKTRDEILREFDNDPRKAIESCIDLRLFGATFSVEKNTLSLTGPVQFNFGMSLHRVEPKLVKGTTVVASGEGKQQGTFTEMWIIPYGLIAFHGVANQFAAEDTGLTDEDLEKMTQAMWLGTKASTTVLSHSKMGHSPRLLIEIVYKEGVKSQIGELDRLVKIETDKDEEAIRDVEEVKFDLSRLRRKLERYRDRIEKIRYAVDERVIFETPLSEIFEGLPVETFPWLNEV
jgi:CRISPR-associated protein Csh2